MFSSTIVLYSGLCWTRQPTAALKQIYSWDCGFVGVIFHFLKVIFIADKIADK